ncbi:snRNA-activating protein complex subunit 3 [Hypsizygus marmoreus]|uniref:snRNA-activating protein complex subunit 3 n=1 Tax=Hypsizygus marmoreus TaxID=39966 RepID=A0A369JR53_HYPMA|nr:snRNA-activating protein complex subunit 3 [Hypsizygus marmoreus]
MNALTFESLFGPPSDPIHIPAFIAAAVPIATPSNDLQDVSQLPQISVVDLRDSLFNVWNNPNSSAHLLKDHEHSITSLYSATKSAKPKRRAHLPDPEDLSPDVAALQKTINEIKLTSWKLQADAALFMRSAKNSDQNVLAQVKNVCDASASLSDDPQAIITLSVHNRLQWGPNYVSRASQHALLSSQTLGDLFDVIPCTSNELATSGDLSDHNVDRRQEHGGCVVCIEGVAYGDGLLQEDYAHKLILHLQTVAKDAPAITKSSSSIRDTALSSLRLRINHPYWLLHQGNCEHFVVVDQIRLQHPADGRSGYPLTLQITPPLLDLCRACLKVPATLSIVGDVRLGESPCLLCSPCWRNIGDAPDCDVSANFLPRHELGW